MMRSPTMAPGMLQRPNSMAMMGGGGGGGLASAGSMYPGMPGGGMGGGGGLASAGSMYPGMPGGGMGRPMVSHPSMMLGRGGTPAAMMQGG